MCDFAAFRSKANATFPDLIVSVMMFEEGKGKSVPVTMYRVKVAGMAIGDNLTSQAASVEGVLGALVRKVGAARRAKIEAAQTRALARRAAMQDPAMRLVVTPGSRAAYAQELAMAA